MMESWGRIPKMPHPPPKSSLYLKPSRPLNTSSHRHQTRSGGECLNELPSFVRAIHESLGFFLGKRKQFAIEQEVRNAELRHTRLPCAGHFAWPAELQVHFRKPEPIRRRNHRLDALARDIVETVGRHQNA